MELEKQVVSLEYAKRLRALGVAEKAQFMWVEELSGNGVYLHPTHDNKIDENACCVSEARYPILYKNYFAYSVAELGEMLPWCIEIKERTYFLELCKNGPNPVVGKTWECWYEEAGPDPKEVFPWPAAQADTEAGARAQMFIYLIENKLYDPHKPTR